MAAARAMAMTTAATTMISTSFFAVAALCLIFLCVLPVYVHPYGHICEFKHRRKKKMAASKEAFDRSNQGPTYTPSPQ